MPRKRRTSQRTAAAKLFAEMMDTTDQIKRLPKVLGKAKKAELIHLLVEMAGENHSFFRQVQARFDTEMPTISWFAQRAKPSWKQLDTHARKHSTLLEDETLSRLPMSEGGSTAWWKSRCVV